MRTYDAATYSDLSPNATVFMIQPAMITEDVIGGNSSPFQVFLDGKSYSAHIDVDGRVRVMVNGDEKILYKAISTGGRYNLKRNTMNRNKDRNRNTRKHNMNHNRSRNHNHNRNHNRNSTNGYLTPK
jgi:hypothetical protein